MFDIKRILKKIKNFKWLFIALLFLLAPFLNNIQKKGLIRNDSIYTIIYPLLTGVFMIGFCLIIASSLSSLGETLRITGQKKNSEKSQEEKTTSDEDNDKEQST